MRRISARSVTERMYVVSGVMTYSCIEGDIVRGMPPR
jgi:hypothetical protein